MLRLSREQYRVALLASVGAVSLLSAPQVSFAQAVSTLPTEVETVIVTGSRPIQESDRAALNVQRNSDV
jgi:hypothetical protein